MPALKTTIDHKLRVRIDDLPEGAFEAMKDALTIPNLAREKAKKMDEWGWERMPPFIDLWEYAVDEPREGPDDGRVRDPDWLVMPRGFLENFATGMEAFGAQVELVEGRKWERLFRVGTPVKPMPWQVGQIEAMLAWEQGMLKAPAGSGKTVAILATIQRLGCKSLIIVNTKDILGQWQRRAATFLGEHYPVGHIGDGKFEVSPYMTVATAQTINSRYDQLVEAGFFEEFSFVCLDECHHATAETYNKILNRFSARYRFGVSATPDKTGDFELAVNVLGPIIHVVKPSEVDSLQKPVVIRVPTQFKFRFRGHKNRYQRSNYPEMIEAIVTDPERNKIIVETVMAERGHHQLLVTKRLEHIQILGDLLLDAGFDEPLMTLTGKDSNEYRENAVEQIGSHPGLMLSTLADEALDIPRLDRMHLVFPQRNAGLVVQQVGRVERKHPDKTEALIFDYVDGQVGPLEAQWKTRKLEVYLPRGYKIEVRRKQT
jgi:superfamily II DNA or RNA helicase